MSLVHCIISCFYRRRFNLLLLRPRKRRLASPRCCSSPKRYVGHFKLIKSHLHVKCDFFWASNGRVLIKSLFLKLGTLKSSFKGTVRQFKHSRSCLGHHLGQSKISVVQSSQVAHLNGPFWKIACIFVILPVYL